MSSNESDSERLEGDVTDEEMVAGDAEEEQFEVEKILRMRKGKRTGLIQYRVKWKGYDE